MFTAVVFVGLLLNVASTIGETTEDSECRPRPPHQRLETERCCNGLDWMGDDFHQLLHSCKDELGFQMPHPPDSGHSWTPPDQSVIECMDECIFKKLGYVENDGTLNAQKIKNHLQTNYTGVWGPVVTTAATKCLASAASSTAASSSCKSGAAPFSKCFGRELFLNCPPSAWTGGDDCDAVKKRLVKCPDLPPPIGKHPKHKHMSN